MKNYFFVLITLMILTSSKTTYGQQSELVYFRYQGYSDTIYALMEGQIFVEDDSSNIIPAGSVEIISYRPCPNDTITYTDEQGRFVTGFCKGNFTVTISKKGYQTIKLINYESDPDQVSHLKAILRKGKDETVYDINKNNKNDLSK